MRKNKRRNQKKWFKIIANNLSQGKPVSRFHARKFLEIVHLFVDTQYINVFRPYWYDQLDNNPEADLITEYKRHIHIVERKIVEMTGIKHEDFNQIAKSLKKDRPRIQRERKEKPRPPVRKLKNPESFRIRMWNGDYHAVTGEKVFAVNSHEFFIYHSDEGHFDLWSVSDVATGSRIWSHQRYKEAVRKAEEIINANYESYVKQVEKILGKAGEA